VASLPSQPGNKQSPNVSGLQAEPALMQSATSADRRCAQAVVVMQVPVESLKHCPQRTSFSHAALALGLPTVGVGVAGAGVAVAVAGGRVAVAVGVRAAWPFPLPPQPTPSAAGVASTTTHRAILRRCALIQVIRFLLLAARAGEPLPTAGSIRCNCATLVTDGYEGGAPPDCLRGARAARGGIAQENRQRSAFSVQRSATVAT
jgi:hypothetical protein